MGRYKKKSYKNNKFKISVLTCNEEFELTDGSSDIQNYLEYILKKHGEKILDPSIRIHVNKIEKRITFKIKTVCYLELLTPETMRLLGSNKNGENVPHLEITEEVLVHCKIFNND